MAGLASVAEPFLELSGMNVLVTAHAGSGNGVIVYGFPFFRMAFFAAHRLVFPGQRIASQTMSREVECGFPESSNRMTRSAIAAIGPRRKLSGMLVDMTIRAVRTERLDAEIRSLMACLAFEYGVAAKQWILRPAVVKGSGYRTPCGLPAGRGVA